MFIPILDYSYGAVISSDEQNFLSNIFLFEFSYFCKYCVVISLFLLLVSYFIMNFFKFILIIPSALGVFNFFDDWYVIMIVIHYERKLSSIDESSSKVTCFNIYINGSREVNVLHKMFLLTLILDRKYEKGAFVSVHFTFLGFEFKEERVQISN